MNSSLFGNCDHFMFKHHVVIYVINAVVLFCAQVGECAMSVLSREHDATGSVGHIYRLVDIVHRFTMKISIVICNMMRKLINMYISRLQSSLPIEENSWRHRRLRSELKTLRSDPPEGIQATPLDRHCCHWQASITGPQGSPYEGGVFLLYLQIPKTCVVTS